MTGRRKTLLISIAAGALVAFGVPFGELWYRCQEPTSEGCVWGKALLPVSLTVGAVLGLGAAALTFVVVHAVQRGRAPRP